LKYFGLDSKLRSNWNKLSENEELHKECTGQSLRYRVH
jgi:hypothetical protein